MVPLNARGNLQKLDCLFLVMELCKYGNLTKLFEKQEDEKKHYRSEQLITIMYNCLCVLKFIHSSNIMHRDIKPSNILITKGTLDVQICDFGLSRSMLEANKNKLKNTSEN